MACRLAEWVAFLHTAVMATVVMYCARNPACTAASALWKERYINGSQEAPLTSEIQECGRKVTLPSGALIDIKKPIRAFIVAAVEAVMIGIRRPARASHS